MFRLLQNHPGLEKEWDEVDPLWGILKFTRGEPTYRVILECNLFAPQKILEAMSSLAQILVTSHDGILWNPQTERFENLNAEEVYKAGRTIYNDISSLMGEVGFKLIPSR